MSYDQNRVNAGSSTETNLGYAASIILQVFKSYDVDGGGTLQRRELRRLLRQCGANLTSRQCDDIIDQLDTDGDGEMNFMEFMSFLGRLYQLQFFGTDAGNFWNGLSQPSSRQRHAPPPSQRGPQAPSLTQSPRQQPLAVRPDQNRNITSSHERPLPTLPPASGIRGQPLPPSRIPNKDPPVPYPRR